MFVTITHFFVVLNLGKTGCSKLRSLIVIPPVAIIILLSSCTGETDYDSMFEDPEAHDKIMTQMMDGKMMERDKK